MSQPVPTFAGCVTASGEIQIDPDRRAAWHAYKRTLAGRRVVVTVKKSHPKRSTKANAYLWGVVYPIIADFCGYDVDELHEELAMKFLRIEDSPITGAPRRKRTPDTDSAEFSEYVDNVIRFGVQLGCYIPAPGETEAA